MEETIDRGNLLIQWHFTEFEKKDRTIAWYIVMLVLAIFFLIIAIITSNFLFAVIIVMSVVIVILHDKKESIEKEIRIFESGFEIDNKFFNYKDINNFFIIYEPPVISNLFIRPKNKLTPTLNIPLVEQNPLKIRDILITFVQEDVEAEEEPTSDYLSRLLKL